MYQQIQGLSSIGGPALQEIEAFSVKIARQAGAILMEYFQKPMAVEYKSDRNRDPVTKADKHSEEYLKEAILKTFPDHSILSEEGGEVTRDGTDYIWVVDPLDGTANFLNGLPLFAVSVAVLHQGRPVVGSIFVPSPSKLEGHVFHASQGGGAFCDHVPLKMASNSQPQRGQVSIFPRYYLNAYRLKTDLRRQVGELRSLGSIAYELAMTARGTIQFALFGGPKAWDVAAGVRIVAEAGGATLVRRPKHPRWETFQAFVGEDGVSLPPRQLKEWRGALIFGNPDVSRFVADGISPKSRVELLAGRWLRRWI